MRLRDIINGHNTDSLLSSILHKIHERGPIEIREFEYLAYIKKIQPDTFKKYEKTLISLIGLFYKTTEPSGLIEEIYSIFADSIEVETGVKFTPVQADAYNKIKGNKYFSFSAPTSAGKSFLFRKIINQTDGDIVIVVPSRALIAEYMHILSNLVEKNVMVLQFVEIVNISKTNKRIFVITPERGVELFKNIGYLNIKLFLFDEAQISEEEIRGMKFDAFVRRVDRVLPMSKKVFTHPFILNPEAQLSKHNFDQDSAHFCYKQNSVGKIYLTLSQDNFKYFSPFEIGPKDDFITAQEDIVEKKLSQNGTALIYTSKNKIYDGSYILDFAKYIDLCEKLANPNALKFVEQLRDYIGASTRGIEKHSNMIEMMERGIVIHHGSIPLKARLIIEAFVNANFAKICFSTSTLIQGINMPFDIVWINNFKFSGTEAQKNLDLKNLIGRAGRNTQDKNKFDFGYVIVEKSNVKTFKKRMQEPSTISPNSLLEENINQVAEDMVDIVQAIKNDTFNDELQLTDTQVKRIKDADIEDDIRLILDNLLNGKEAIKGQEYYNLGKPLRNSIKQAFQHIFIAHLRRKELTKSEKTILSASIPILLWQVQGKSFKEIVSLRHAYLTNKDEQRSITNKVRRKEITALQGAKLRKALTIRYSPMAAAIPNPNVSAAGLFGRNESIVDMDYDKLVYDTYDYLDKVIGLCLMDPLWAAFQLYNEKTSDIRALWMANYIKYGTNDITEIWLLKYGFSFDDVEWIKDIVLEVNENQIEFVDDISGLKEDQLNIIKHFL